MKRPKKKSTKTKSVAEINEGERFCILKVKFHVCCAFCPEPASSLFFIYLFLVFWWEKSQRPQLRHFAMAFQVQVEKLGHKRVENKSSVNQLAAFCFIWIFFYLFYLFFFFVFWITCEKLSHTFWLLFLSWTAVNWVCMYLCVCVFVSCELNFDFIGFGDIIKSCRALVVIAGSVAFLLLLLLKSFTT